MMRQWVKILVLVLALLSQMAMACPRDDGQQSSGSSSPESPPPSRRGILKERPHEAPVEEGSQGLLVQRVWEKSSARMTRSLQWSDEAIHLQAFCQ